ncbi:MAG TPA: hypothetical protein P5509_08840 [Bacteroidales bacterium]|nr:hypothetical protein [Bacteroidales bacterium]
MNNKKVKPKGMSILDKPIKVIMKDKWREIYYGYLWAWELPNTRLGKMMDSIKAEIVAYKLDDEKHITNFAYSVGSTKWYETKIKSPKKVDVPHWDDLIN